MYASLGKAAMSFRGGGYGLTKSGYMSVQVGPDSVALLLCRPFEAANFPYPLRGFYILHKTLPGMKSLSGYRPVSPV